MGEVFELIDQTGEEEENKSLRIGVRMTLGNQESLCPLTRPSSTYEALAADVVSLQQELDILLDRAKSLFNRSALAGELGLDPAMNAGEIWTCLSKTTDDETFIEGFNGLEEAQRREVAEHALTKCNIFSGRAAFFSARYNEKSGSLE